MASTQDLPGIFELPESMVEQLEKAVDGPGPSSEALRSYLKQVRNR